MGWNQLEIIKNTDIFEGIANNSNFYFVHSYYCDPKESNIVTGKTTYSIEMCVSLKKITFMRYNFILKKVHKMV